MDTAEIQQAANKYYKEIYFFCLQKVNYKEVLAKDLVQDVFLMLQIKHNTLQANNIRSWLYTVADKKVYETFRKNEQRKQWLPLDADMPLAKSEDILAQAEKQIDDEEIERIKTEILQSLPPSSQTLYAQLYVEKRPYTEIAALHNTSENTVRVQGFRLRQEIGALIKTTLQAINK